jgi:uncharacterized protein with gpF-like domain
MPKLRLSKAATIAPVHPNAGIEAEYRKRLEALIDAMNKSIKWWVLAAYRADLPDTTNLLAQDDSSAVRLAAVMNKLSRYWNRKFKIAAKELAKYYSKKITKRADDTLEKILKDSGLAIQFKLTDAANDVLQATTKANVELITNISQKAVTDITGMVMRSVQSGHDVGALAKQLEEQFGMTRKRAKLIARDQNAKATASIVRTRQAELGITEAKWIHSHGGKTPRQSHVDFAAGKNGGPYYDVKQGAYIDGEYIFPGEEINCRCVSRAVVPGLGRR